MVIAFIPVRGGSKSIPLKNIKPFCGKPLVCWNIEALEQCDAVDQIIVATDSDAIADVVVGQHYAKTTIYRRSDENASDIASTESAMLEYISYAHLSENDIFMLVQATSPLTQTIHFSEALKMYSEGRFDSILTCVRTHRFFWNADGTSMNYDYKNRPRRQNFEGMLMENGAFYINSVKNILASKNRLSGKIGIYEMPEYTAMEIDEPDDWFILEKLMYKYVLRKQNDVSDIKLFMTDVDGTLTDAGMYYTENGDELKKFNTRDGMVFATVPQQCVRPVEWKLAEWQRSVTTFLDPCSHEAMLQLNEWTRGGVCNPACIDYGFQMLMMSTESATPQLELARCVVRPADGSYQFHYDLLSTIPEWNQSLSNPLV